MNRPSYSPSSRIIETMQRLLAALRLCVNNSLARLRNRAFRLRPTDALKLTAIRTACLAVCDGSLREETAAAAEHVWKSSRLALGQDSE